MSTTKHIQKLITFPDPLYKKVKNRADKIGMSFSEYIRMVIFLYTRADFDNYELLDEETSREVEKSMKDFKEGRYVTLEPGQDLHEFLKKL